MQYHVEIEVGVDCAGKTRQKFQVVPDTGSSDAPPMLWKQKHRGCGRSCKTRRRIESGEEVAALIVVVVVVAAVAVGSSTSCCCCCSTSQVAVLDEGVVAVAAAVDD